MDGALVESRNFVGELVIKVRLKLHELGNEEVLRDTDRLLIVDGKLIVS